MDAELRNGAKKIAEEIGLGIEIELVGHFDPVTFDQGCVETIRGAAERLGYSHRDIVSGAGHDPCWINRVAPTAMRPEERRVGQECVSTVRSRWLRHR